MWYVPAVFVVDVAEAFVVGVGERVGLRGRARFGKPLGDRR